MKTKNTKKLECRKGCGNTSEVAMETTAVTCWRCVQKELNGQPIVPNDDEFRKLVNED